MKESANSHNRREFLSLIGGAIVSSGFAPGISLSGESATRIVTDLHDPVTLALVQAEGEKIASAAVYHKAATMRTAIQRTLAKTTDPALKAFWQSGLQGVRTGMNEQPLLERIIREMDESERLYQRKCRRIHSKEQRTESANASNARSMQESEVSADMYIMAGRISEEADT